MAVVVQARRAYAAAAASYPAAAIVEITQGTTWYVCDKTA